MARWTDLATWRGPTANQGGAMAEHRGLVVHIAEGYFEGTIAWQRNASAQVSSHFIVARDGQIAQMVDTDVTAWTQRAGNGRWLSVENEGFTPAGLTEAQLEANARLLAKAHQAYGVPLQVTGDANGRGLGHHSMGGTAWGHLDCPGPAIIAQKPIIVARTAALLEEDDMPTADEIAKAVWGFGIKQVADDRTQAASTMLRYANYKIYDVAAKLGQDQVDEAAIARQVLAGLSPAAIADAVVAVLPGDLAAQVVTELGARINPDPA